MLSPASAAAMLEQMHRQVLQCILTFPNTVKLPKHKVSCVPCRRTNVRGVWESLGVRSWRMREVYERHDESQTANIS